MENSKKLNETVDSVFLEQRKELGGFIAVDINGRAKVIFNSLLERGEDNPYQDFMINFDKTRELLAEVSTIVTPEIMKDTRVFRIIKDNGEVIESKKEVLLSTIKYLHNTGNKIKEVSDAENPLNISAKEIETIESTVESNFLCPMLELGGTVIIYETIIGTISYKILETPIDILDESKDGYWAASILKYNKVRGFHKLATDETRDLLRSIHNALSMTGYSDYYIVSSYNDAPLNGINLLHRCIYLWRSEVSDFRGKFFAFDDKQDIDIAELINSNKTKIEEIVGYLFNDFFDILAVTGIFAITGDFMGNEVYRRVYIDLDIDLDENSDFDLLIKKINGRLPVGFCVSVEETKRDLEYVRIILCNILKVGDNVSYILHTLKGDIVNIEATELVGTILNCKSTNNRILKIETVDE